MAVNVAELKATLTMDMTAFTGNANTAITTLNNIKAAADSAKASLQAMGQQARSLSTVATALTRVSTAATNANKNLQAFAANAALFNSLNASLASITATAQTLATAIQGVAQSLNQMATQARGMNNLNASMTAAVTTMTNLKTVGYAISGLGREWMIGITLPIAYLGKEALDTAVRFDSLDRALTAITGSSKIAAEQMARLNEIAKLPGIGLEEAVQGSINLQSAGMSANTAERAIKAFGNALVYSGRGKEELVGIEQILAKIQGREILSERQFTQLTLRVPKMRALLKEAFGTGDVEVIQKSGLPVEKILERLIYAAEQIPKVTGGIQNDIDNFHDHVTRSLKILGDAITPIAHEFLTTVGPEIEKFANWFKGLPDWEKKGVLIFAGLAAGVGPFLFALGQVLITVGRIQTALAGLQIAGSMGGLSTLLGTSLAGGTLTLGAAAGIGAIGVAGGIAGGYGISAAVDAAQGKQDPGIWATIQQMPGALGDQLLRTLTGGKYGVDTGNLPGADKPIILPPKTKSSAKPEGWGTTPEGPEAKAKRLKEEREIQRLKLDAELEAARSKIDLSEPGHAQQASKDLEPILKKQAADLRKEAEEMKVGKASTASEWKDYYRIVHDASAKELEIQRLKAAGDKEEKNAARALRSTNQRLSEMKFRGIEAGAQADAYDNAPEGMQAQTMAKTLTPVIKARQAELVQLWHEAEKDTGDANETAIRRAQLEDEYWQLQRKGAQINKQSADEMRKNAKQAERDSMANAKAYRSFQMERVKVLAEEAETETQQSDILTREIPLLRDDQAELLREANSIKPNTKAYWDNARAYWQIEDEITKLTKNQAKARQNDLKKANQAAQQQAHEHREMLDLETHLMEARLKNNPFLSDAQRKNLMVPMLIRQYRAMMQPVAGETELESLRRQVDAENMKHDILEQFGLGKNQGARVLGGGRLNMTGLNPRALKAAMAQLDAPMTDRERGGMIDPHVRARALAAEAANGRPVVVQVTWQPGMTAEQVKQQLWKLIDEMTTSHDPVIAR